MKAVFGLGNPGRQYRQTRHNLGFLAIDRYLERLRAQASFPRLFGRLRLRGRRLDRALVYRGKGDLLLVKPLTYMNHSGLAVKAIISRFGLRLEDSLVVCDDVALPWGRLRARAKGGAGGHGGLASIIAELGTEEFPRLRIGIGKEGLQGDLAPYVLGRLTPEELARLEPVLARVARAIDLFHEGGIEPVMNEVNREES
ncbi:MAG: aminoacyl-tRNA hydrolase [Candidatus Acetothermia bacterium]|nr:aminoacyl-tRNA hydrolase [Candidatus Acetothermia bacterium]MDH7506109.1 aminoacyl-tRNA hydrolase [Candidatus Acetothermia bacterium]